MVEEAEWVVLTTPGKQLRLQPVHWNGHGRVALIGEIDLGNVRYAEALLNDMASSGTPLTLDLARLSFLDSQGVAMFFRLAKRAEGNGGSIALANPRDIVRRVLDITHVGDTIPIREDGWGASQVSP